MDVSVGGCIVSREFLIVLVNFYPAPAAIFMMPM
jgi:hypothetical protein